MNQKRLLLVMAMLLSLYLLAACQPQEVVREVEVPVRVTVAAEEEEAEPTLGPNKTDLSDTLANADSASQPANSASQPAQRLIIKNGTMIITVQDTDEAVQSAALHTQEFGGYILSQQIEDGRGGYRYAEINLAVPVAEFDNAMRTFRTLGDVTSETASGEDVTEEYVDLDSRLGNLQATQTRLRSFLDQANNVTETLAIDRELRQIEEELEVIQGRMTYLTGRAAYSTINLTLNPETPPTPLPTAESWRPSDTAQLAAVQLQETAQETADFTIFYGISCGPWLLAAVVLGWLAWRLWRRMRRARPA